MTDARVSRVAADTLIEPPRPALRSSRMAVDALTAPSPDSRVTRATIEALVWAPNLFATLPRPTAALTGVWIPTNAQVAGALPRLGATLTGSRTIPSRSGRVAGTLPKPSGALTGTRVLTGKYGPLAGTLSKPTTSLRGFRRAPSISYVGGGAASASSGGNLTVTLPTVQDGDLGIAYVASAGQLTSGPAGWDPQLFNLSTALHIRTLAAADSGADVTFNGNFDGTHRGVLVIAVYRGAKVGLRTQADTSGTSGVLTALPTFYPESMIVSISGFAASAANAQAMTSPAQFFRARQSINDQSAADIADQYRPVAGPSDLVTVTSTVAAAKTGWEIRLDPTASLATLDASLRKPTMATTGYVPPPTSTTLAATLPKPTTALTGVFAAARLGSLNGALKKPTVALTGTRTIPARSGTLAGDLPALESGLTGARTIPARSGTLSAWLPSASVALTGVRIPPGVGGLLAASLPSPVQSALTGMWARALTAAALNATLPRFGAVLAGLARDAVAVPTGFDLLLLDEEDGTFDSDQISSAERPDQTHWWSYTPTEVLDLTFDLDDTVPVDWTPTIDPDTDVESDPPPVDAILTLYTGTSASTMLEVISGTSITPTGLAVGTTYYLKASIPAGDPDVLYQLSVGPAADAQLYLMDLEVLSGPLRTAPTGVVVQVMGGPADDTVTFKIDGVDVPGTWDLDPFGNLPPTSVEVPDGTTKGDHIISVHSESTDLAGEGTFTLLRNPYTSLQIVGMDADPVEVPEANTSTGVRRWVLQDLMPGGLGSWVMDRNPTSMSSPEYQRTLFQEHTTAKDGQYHLSSVALQSFEWTFSGYVDTEFEQNQLLAYYGLNRRFYVIDHRTRAWIVAWQRCEIVPRRRQRNDDSSFNDWAADYTVTALIYDQDPRVPR